MLWRDADHDGVPLGNVSRPPPDRRLLPPPDDDPLNISANWPTLMRPFRDGIVTAHSLRDPWLRLEWSHSVLILEPRPFKLSMHETHQNPYELMRTLFFEHEPLYADEHHIRLPLIQRATTNRQRRLMAQSLVSSHVEDDRLMTAAIYTWVRRKRALECVDNIRMLHLVILHRPSPDWPLGFLRVAARPDVTATVFCAALESFEPPHRSHSTHTWA